MAYKMKKNKIYYLKKYHSPLITLKTENTKAVIDIIDDYNGSIVGHYVDDPETTFNCRKHEFSKIFTAKCPDGI
mgnify:FL=1